MRYRKIIKAMQEAILIQNEMLESHNRTIADILEALEHLSARLVELNSQQTSQET